MNNLGYNKNLYILPFDHRSTFMNGMFGISGREPTNDETHQIKELKNIIYNAFKKAIEKDIKKEDAAILVDEQFGEEILKDAALSSITTILTTEKSGQKEFDFEYGNDFGEHIKKMNPAFAKALVRYNPSDDQILKIRQQERLKILSDFCHKNGYKFLIEVLIDPTEDQLKKAQGDKSIYNRDIRPSLALAVVGEFQDGGVEPDVWKMEGMENSKDYEALVAQIRKNGRDGVGVVVLGGGEDAGMVDKWIFEGGKVNGIIGFAVGRTVFWQALEDFRKGEISREQVISQIAENFIHFHDVFMKGREAK